MPTGRALADSFRDSIPLASLAEVPLRWRASVAAEAEAEVVASGAVAVAVGDSSADRPRQKVRRKGR